MPNSVTDRLLRIDCEGGSIYVHKHLLCERSERMERVIEELEEEIDSGLSSIHTQSWGGWMTDKRLWELYIGYLYGHPLWIRSQQHSIEEDFKQLALLRDDVLTESYDDAVPDVAMDAIRELVTQHGEALSRPFNFLAESTMNDESNALYQFLLDFMVYGQSGRVFGKWYAAYVKSGHSASFDRHLADRFSEKADAESEGRDLPDIMEQCRYHYHPDDTCYLDQ